MKQVKNITSFNNQGSLKEDQEERTYMYTWPQYWPDEKDCTDMEDMEHHIRQSAIHNIDTIRFLQIMAFKLKHDMFRSLNF